VTITTGWLNSGTYAEQSKILFNHL
jgi:hypothetical protein